MKENSISWISNMIQVLLYLPLLWCKLRALDFLDHLNRRG